MNRREFFRKALPLAAFPAAAAAGGVAKILDPEGEPIPADQAAIIVNAPGVTLRDFSVTGVAKRGAPSVLLTERATDSFVTGGYVEEIGFQNRRPWSE